MSLPSQTLRRTQISSAKSIGHQCRHASLLKRPHRPYTFTQLITLSDGSTYTRRTTSPAPIYRSTKDTRNHPLWQPSLDSLRNVEQDEAGRLRAFRERFGRGWDLESQEEGQGEEKEGGMVGRENEKDSLMDLISGGGYAQGTAVEKGRERVKEANEVEMVTVKIDGVLVKVPKTKKERN